LAILARGESCRAYNVGSDEAVTIGELALRIGAAAGGLPVTIARLPDPGRPPARYVPAIDRAREELGLSLHVGLSEAISRTLTSLRGQMDTAVCRW
jgi:nucleoside-diphosphate-sugar epimerase